MAECFGRRHQAGYPGGYSRWLSPGARSGLAQPLRGFATGIHAIGLDAVQRMKAMPTDDDCFGPGMIRAAGRKIHPAHQFEVTSPAENVFQPLEEAGCGLVRQPLADASGGSPWGLTSRHPFCMYPLAYVVSRAAPAEGWPSG